MKMLFIGMMASATSAKAESFKGYKRTQHCSGQEAGYPWVMRKGVTDSALCFGKSKAFAQGNNALAERE